MRNNILEIVLRLKDELSKEMETMTKKVQKTGENIQKVGTEMIKIGAAPTAALVLAAKTAIEYESAFAGVRKTVDASEAEFEKLSDNIRKIAKETPVSANELAKIGELAGQLGVRGVDNLTKFIDTISKVGVTTNLTTEAAATSFARIANIMQEPIENVDRMASAIVELGNNFATTESEIVEFSTRIAGAGKIAGLTTADIFGIATAFSSVGVQAEAGGTAVQKVLIAMTQAASGSTAEIIDNTKEIAKNSSKLEDLQGKLALAQKQQSEFGEKVKESTKMAKQAQIDKYSSQIAQLTGNVDALNATHGQTAISASAFAEVLGVTNKQFEEMFEKDPSEVFDKFIAKLGDAGNGAMKILEDLELTDQRLIRGFLSTANAGDLLTRTVKSSSEAWKENTASTEEFRKRAATTESQIQIVKNNIADMGITLGAVLLPALNDFINKMKPVINTLAEFIENNPKLVVGVLGFGAALLGIGTVLVIFGTALKAIAVVLGGLGAGALKFAVFLAGISAPVWLAIGAIVALIAIGYLLWKNWDFIKVKSIEIWESIVEFFSHLPERVGAFFTDLFLNRIPYAVGYAYGWLSVKIPELMENMGNWFWQMVLHVGVLMIQFYDTIVNAVISTWEWIKTEVPTWPTKIYNFIKSIPGLVKQVFEDAKKWAIDKMGEMYDGILGIWNKIKGIFENISSKANDAWNAVKRSFEAGKNAGIQGYAKGGWVDQTGLAVVHEGEYVMSKDMLAGRQSVDSRVQNSNNKSVTINAVINNPLDFDRIIDTLSWKLDTAY